MNDSSFGFEMCLDYNELLFASGSTVGIRSHKVSDLKRVIYYAFRS